MIPLWGAQADGGKLILLDDTSVVKDLTATDGTGGTAFTATLLSARFLTAAWNDFRRLFQRIFQAGGATVTATPWIDGQETGQTITRTLTGDDPPPVTFPFMVSGTDYQVALAVSSFTQTVELGNAEVWIIPGRSQRS